ncbi:MAG: D-aminoacyl-tRNA deacylase [Sulfolobaceae archaeon]
MDIKLIYSTADPVGITIHKLKYKELEPIDEDVVDFRYEKGNAIVMLCRHESKNKVPAITLHFPGNPTSSILGGEPKKLGIAYPSLLSSIYRELLKVDFNIQIILEATHHGPTYQNVPILFVEIGSSYEYWTNESLVSKFVNAVIKGVNNLEEVECNSKIAGFGGPHYAQYFTKLARENCIGHIISKHYLKELEDYVVFEVVNKSIENIDTVVFDNVNLEIRKRILRLLPENIIIKSR